MNIKMKALVAAAVAAMSVSGAASAATDWNDSIVFLTVVDRTNNISAVFDLGFTYQTFVAGGADSASSFSWDLSAGAHADTWNTFFGTANAATTIWGVAAVDSEGNINVAGNQGFISTYIQGTTLPASVNGNFITNIGRKAAQYLDASEANGNVSTSGQGYANNLYGATGLSLNGRGPNGLAALGAEQGVVQYLNGAGATRFQDPIVYDASFQLSADGVLRYTVAAVPEPETYALLLAGLGLVGAAARRRKSA
ncbi:PEPxxWA-CTERM sorting domain-containing protein [Methylobacillus flagellatus]|uniref:PEPxxWA-CTERM sorting domain-containing protein n=1 Tax=Methylobacillus flagellatus TaxID=405 RepID=UPI002868DADA|nr:PEPxxWA-CTERM sorting domain-containing protein [Methylobacillus flagellatus]